MKIGDLLKITYASIRIGVVGIHENGSLSEMLTCENYVHLLNLEEAQRRTEIRRLWVNENTLWVYVDADEYRQAYEVWLKGGEDDDEDDE